MCRVTQRTYIHGTISLVKERPEESGCFSYYLEEVAWMKLTEKQRAWIDYYKQGHSAAEAARLAGYRGNNHDVIGAQNLAKLSKFITDRDAVLDASRIAGMEEINAFWTDTMRDEAAERRDRLKASELRARSLGAFIDRQEITVQATGWYIDDNDVSAT